MTKTEKKGAAQKILMDAIALRLGNIADHGWYSIDDKDAEAMNVELKKQADRVAKILGYEQAWKVS